MTDRLELVPISRDEAFEFCRRHHRHHPPRLGHKFSIAAARDGEIVAVATVGRPVSRGYDDGWTLEVSRLTAVDGARNACSMLYAAAWRAARALGYRRVITSPGWSAARRRRETRRGEGERPGRRPDSPVPGRRHDRSRA